MEKVGGVAGVPAAEPVFEFELHEVAGDGGYEHAAGLTVDGVVELEDAVVLGPPRPRLHRPARQDLRHGLRHRRLLRHVQHADRAAAAGLHRERGWVERRGGGLGWGTAERAGGLKFPVWRSGFFFFFLFLEKSKAVSRCFLFLKKMDWAVKLNGPISTEKFMGFMWPFSEGAVSKKKHKKKHRV